MRRRRNRRTYLFAIPAATLLVVFLGNLVTGGGMEWYRTLALPWFTPPGGVIGLVWTVIFILSAISAVEWWSQKERDRRFWTVAALFVANAALNVGWSAVFFGLQQMAAGVWVAALLSLSTWLLVATMWRRKAVSSALLLPYAAWATFATYLTYAVASLNGAWSFFVPAGVGLFAHLAGFIVGIGAATTVDVMGILGKDSGYWTETAIRAQKVTRVMAWVGLALATVGGALWHGAWTPIASAQAVLALVLALNGCYLSFVVSPFLSARESMGCARMALPNWMQRRIAAALVVSAAGWWSALALTVAALVS